MKSLHFSCLIAWSLFLLPFTLSAQDDVWESLQGPEGGLISSLAVAPTGDLYAVAAFKKLYRSQDEAETWTQFSFPGKEPNYIFILSNGTMLVTDVTGLWRSVNQGVLWSKTSGYHFHRMLEASDGTIIGACENGMFRSLDKGLQWSPAGLFNVYVYDASIGNSDEVYVVGYNYNDSQSHLYRTQNYGISWDTILNIENWEYLHAVEALNSGTLLVAGDLNIFRSLDAGLTWDTLEMSGIFPFWETPDGILYGKNYELGLLRSVDEGDSWSPAGLVNQDVLCLVGKPVGSVFVGTSGRGVARWNEENPVWEFVNHGLVASTVQMIELDGQGQVYGLDGTRLHVWNPASWEWSFMEVPGEVCNFLYIAPDSTILVSEYTHMAYSYDGGANWTMEENFGFYKMAFSGDAWYGARIDWQGTGEEGLFRSLDQGQTWEDINPYGGSGWTYITDIFVGADHSIFVSFLFDNVPFNMRSDDGGDTWQNMDELGNLRAVVFAEGPDIMYAAGANDQNNKNWIFNSLDGGQTWTFVKELGFSFQQLEVNASGHLFLNNGSNIFKSANGGKTWKLYGDPDLSGGSPLNMALAPDDFLYVSYPGHGVWRTAHATTPAIDVATGQPLEMSVFPNPSSEIAWLRFRLPETGALALECYDAGGNLVWRAAPMALPGGAQEIPVAVRDWPSGVYFMRLTADKGTGVVKMLVE